MAIENPPESDDFGLVAALFPELLDQGSKGLLDARMILEIPVPAPALVFAAGVESGNRNATLFTRVLNDRVVTLNRDDEHGLILRQLIRETVTRAADNPGGPADPEREGPGFHRLMG